MRVLLDTNVLIAAFIARGSCHQLFEHCIRHHEMITSEFILNELVEKLTDRFRFSTETANEATSLVESHSEVVEWQPLPGPVCRDSDDDAVLATAMAGRCQTIVTGDKDLLSLGEYAGIDIVSPAVWMEQHAGE